MFKQVIVLRTDLDMGKGKMCAQASHASLEAYMKSAKKNPDWAATWLAEGQKKIVLKVDSEDGLITLFMRVKNVIPAAMISDAGATQLEPGTKTAIAFGPAPEPELDKFVSTYKLL